MIRIIAFRQQIENDKYSAICKISSCVGLIRISKSKLIKKEKCNLISLMLRDSLKNYLCIFCRKFYRGGEGGSVVLQVLVIIF